MKNLLCISLIFFTIISLNAQVGIGTTTPNAGAELDIVSTDKGILIPRLESNAVGSPAQGMMIYQPSDSSFYFYRGSQWMKLGGSNFELVDADGDTKIKLIEGTNDKIDFQINGAYPFSFEKGTGSKSFNLDYPTRNVGIGPGSLNANDGSDNVAIGAYNLFENTSGSRNVAIGTYNIRNNEVGNDNIGIGNYAMVIGYGNHNIAMGDLSFGYSIGDNNIAIGQRTLTYSNVSQNIAIGTSAMEGSQSTPGTGDKNIAIGTEALKNNTTGNSNNALGSFALLNNTTGSQNTALGASAGLNGNGSANVFIGAETGASSSGNGNVAIGTNAGENGDSLNVFIGNGAGQSETGSNKLYIANADGNSSDALIYGEFDKNQLRVNDQLGIGMAAQSSYGLTLKAVNVVPTVDGILKIYDSNENETWHLRLQTNGNLGFTESGQADNRFVLEKGGNLGIGLPDPEANLHIQSGSDPTLKIQSSGTDEISGRLSLRQSNETGVDIYYDGNNATDALVIQPLTGGVASAKKVRVDLVGRVIIDTMETVTSGDMVMRKPDGTLAKKKGIKIGDYIHGGVVFWLDPSGEHGLVCALNEFASEQWGVDGILDGTDFDGYYAGKRNTAILLAKNDPTLLGKKCAKVEDGSYGDWYLPAHLELLALKFNKSIVNSSISQQGGTLIGDVNYWSSTETNASRIIVVDLDSQGGASTKSKENFYRAKAIRAF